MEHKHQRNWQPTHKQAHKHLFVLVLRFGSARFAVVLGHQRQGRGGHVVVVAVEAAQAADGVVPGEEAFLLIVGVTAEQRQNCSPVVRFTQLPGGTDDTTALNKQGIFN